MNRFLERYEKYKEKNPRLARFYLALYYISEGYSIGKATKMASCGNIFYQYARQRRYLKMIREAQEQGFYKNKERGLPCFEIKI